MESKKAYSDRRYKRKQRIKMIKANKKKLDKGINEENNMNNNKVFN